MLLWWYGVFVFGITVCAMVASSAVASRRGFLLGLLAAALVALTAGAPVVLAGLAAWPERIGDPLQEGAFESAVKTGLGLGGGLGVLCAGGLWWLMRREEPESELETEPD